MLGAQSGDGSKRPGIISSQCQYCNVAKASYYSREDAKSTCWQCCVVLRQGHHVMFDYLIVADGVARIDRGRVSGLVVCDACGLEFYDHKPFATMPFLTELCDGSVAKL